MIREEINGYSEPPRPAPKMRPWIPIALVAFVALAVVARLAKPLATMALQSSQGGSDSQRTPGQRLIGDWESDNDPMFRRVCYPAPKKGYDGTGVYRATAGRYVGDVLFKVTSEDRSGQHVEMAEYRGANYRVRYSIAEDGKSMTREYEGSDGRPVSCQYRYLGPPTEDVPIKYN